MGLLIVSIVIQQTLPQSLSIKYNETLKINSFIIFYVINLYSMKMK